MNTFIFILFVIGLIEIVTFTFRLLIGSIRMLFNKEVEGVKPLPIIALLQVIGTICVIITLYFLLQDFNGIA